MNLRLDEEKTNKIIIYIVALVAAAGLIGLVFFSNMPVYAIEQTARLRKCLQSDPLFKSVSIYDLNDALYKNKEVFKKQYDDQYVVISGNVTVISISKNRKEVMVSDSVGNKCVIDTSADETKKAAGSLSSGSRIVVYGKIDVTGILNDSYEIEAVRLADGVESTFTQDSNLFYPKDEYNKKNTIQIDELTSKSTVVKYRIPLTWNDDYVRSPLTNNGVKGYQYFLNCISPPKTDHPEVFYIFYFTNETFLDNPPSEGSDHDNKEIEKAVIRNILRDNNRKIKIEGITPLNRKDLHYYTTTQRLGDKDYRLEFVFKPDKKGITCMLYLYYPNEEAVRHVRDVAYLIETIEISNK